MTRFSLELSRLGVSRFEWERMCESFMLGMYLDVTDLLLSFGDES